MPFNKIGSFLLLEEALRCLVSEVFSFLIPIVGLNVLQLTASEISFATMLLSLGYLLFSYVLGRLADRLGRKRLILTSLGVASFVKWGYFLIVLGMGVTLVSIETTMGAWIPELFRREEWLKVNGGIQGTKSVANLLGPFLGGMMVSSFQVPMSLLILSGLLMVGMGMLSTIKSAGCEEVKINEAPEPFNTSFFRRVKFALKEPSLRAVLLTTATLNLAMSLYQTLLLLYLMTSLNLGESLSGFVLTVSGIGAVLGAVFSRRFIQVVGLNRTMFLMPLLGGIGVLFMALPLGKDWMFLLVMGQFLSLFARSVGSTARTTVWQLKVPSTIRGEMNGMMMTLTWGMIPLGSFLAAVFAPFISYSWMIVIAAFLIMGASVWTVGVWKDSLITSASLSSER